MAADEEYRPKGNEKRKAILSFNIMGRKQGNIIELFVDKAALAVAGLAALVILYVFVIHSRTIKYDGREVSPTEIDDVVNKKARRLEDLLRKEPNTAERYESKKPQYVAMLKDSIRDVNSNIYFPLPGYPGKATGVVKRTYHLPQIPPIGNSSVAMVRMAAFVPTEELSTSLAYENATTKPEDIDLVTVESSLDIKQLYAAFRQSFAGKQLPEGWRDEQFAKPVFAKVELQRKTLLPDGTWSDWSDIPRTKICSLKKELRIPQEASENEIGIALVKFGRSELRNEILQPPVYYNAIPTDEWLSPSFYNERLKRLAKEQEELKRQELEAEKARKLRERASLSTRSTRQPVQQPLGRGVDMAPGRTMPAPTAVRNQPQTRTLPGRPGTTAAVNRSQEMSEAEQFKAVKLPETDINPAEFSNLVFWAHDDTTKPGQEYKYRIRVGVFNPVAGRNWVAEDQNSLKNQIILWSNFSDVNEVVEIPQRLHFFATDMREIRRSSGVDCTVEVMVAKYTLGNWLSQTFSVKNGEVIGTVVETSTNLRAQQAGIESETIDFSTGAVMIDTEKVNDWSGAGVLRPREYSELLYSLDGKTIEKTAIKERYWSSEVSKIYKEISDSLKAEPVKLLSFSEASSGGRAGRGTIRTRDNVFPDRGGITPGTGTGAGTGPLFR